MTPRWRRYVRIHENDVEAEVRDELAFHVEMRAEALRAAGMEANAARREAERRFGDLTGVVTHCRSEAERSWRKRRIREVLMALFRDGVQTFRWVRRRPLFFAGACVTLALGIGATTAVYSMVDAVLLAPLPYSDPDRLVLVQTLNGQPRQDGLAREVRERLRRDGTSFSGIAAWGGGSRIMSGVGEPEEIEIGRTENNLFALLGVRPAFGTLFNAEHRPEGGNGRVVLLSWSLWQRRFGGDPDVIGRTVDLNERPYVILGVMPAGFEFPVGSGIEAWIPLIHAPVDDALRHTPVESAIARLRTNVDIGTATAEAAAVVARDAATGTDMFGDPMLSEGDAPWSARVLPVREAMLVSDRALVLLLGAVALLLAIACANVANLFLVRASERRGELAVRAALGGSRRDLAASTIAEVGIVCLAAAATGLLLAHWGIGAFAALDPGGLPRWDGIHLSGRVWATASVATALAAIFCALAPALAAAGASPVDVIRSDARATDTTRRLRLRDAVVAFEIGLVFVLLVGTGLLLRSFAAVRSVDTGYDVENVITARVVLPSSRYPSGPAALQFYDEALARLTAHPAVIAAGVVTAAPMSEGGMELTAELESPVTGRKATGGRLHFISPDYFATLGIGVRGRDFTSADVLGAPRVAILNESMARHMFPADDAVGKRFRHGPGEWEVVGVVQDVHYDSPERTPTPTYYAPHRQFPFPPGMVLAVRTIGSASAFGHTLIDIIRGIDPALPVADVRTLEQNLSRVLARRRFDVVMLASIALAALGLAAVGVFGVMGHAVSQRRQELGIRQALGARAGDIVRLVLRRSLRITAVGVAGGAIAAFIALRALQSVLFGVAATDPLTFVLATCTVAVVALLAALVPARRAVRIDAVDTLRS